MSQRFTDYAVVLFVVLILSVLFRLSRRFLGFFIKSQEKNGTVFSSDDALLWGLRFLLGAMLLLPFVTAILAFVQNDQLFGGIALHLTLTAISVVFFSFAEDLFRDYNRYNKDVLKPVAWHTKRLLPAILVFWAIGCVFLSPLFYSGLTVLIAVFYGLCLYFRKTPEPVIKSRKKNNA